jgi:hypothetical protein
MDIATGIIRIWSQAGINIVLGGILTGAMASIGAANLATIAGQRPPPRPVGLADGGIVMPKTGGTFANIAEAGQPEIIFPLDQLKNFLSSGNINTSTNSMTHLIINLDSKPFLEKIFPATKNRTVLISQGAVV